MKTQSIILKVQTEHLLEVLEALTSLKKLQKKMQKQQLILSVSPPVKKQSNGKEHLYRETRHIHHDDTIRHALDDI